MDKKTHPNSRKITVFRAGSFLSRAQGKEIEDHFSEAKVSIGSYFESANSLKVASGLSFKEEELLLPPLIDTPANDRDFRKKVSEFYQEIDTKVPHQGLDLEIGLETDNEGPVSEKNMPIKITDYIRYRHMKKHPYMAASKDEADSNPLKQYYIFDKEEMKRGSKKKMQAKDSAMQIYLKLKENMEEVNMMLTLMGDDYRAYPVGERAERLRYFAENKADEFNTTYEAGKLEIRAWIQNMVRTNVIKMMGSKFIDNESQKLIANNLEELVFFFEDTENADAVVALKARLQEAMAKPVTEEIRKTKALPGSKTVIN